ncbi:amino acid adenylation domain-containing protein [Streptomyces sp. NPDC055929]|uniref:non-ribosomal peptide synthetase n=1 Tax=Streptomyces sp. NPDC055929 TaxID=3345662 RepID=UPI0035DEB3E4
MTAHTTPPPLPAAPPALLPADRPRQPGLPPAPPVCERLVLEGSSAAAEDPALLGAFAAVLHRFTQQDAFAWSARTGARAARVRLHHRVASGTTAADLARAATPAGPASGNEEQDGPDAGQPHSADEFELVLHPCAPSPEPRRTVELRYDARLFDAATAHRLLGSYRTLLDDALARPDTPVTGLRLLGPDELHRILVEWNDTAAALPRDSCLHTAFEQRALLSPKAPAVIEGGREHGYDEIDTAANRLAHRLRGLGIGPDARVGVCLDRSTDLLVAVLGVLKAGGAYVPLDPDYPGARLAAMVAGSSCSVVVSRGDLAGNLPAARGAGEAGPELVLLDRDGAALDALPAHAPEGGAGPDDLAYVIHTSGSTGAPKPIALRHRGVVNNIADLNTRFGVGPEDRVLALSSPSFDMSVYEFLGLTAAGGTVVVPDPARTRDPGHWAELLAAHRITVWNSAPALLELAVDHLEVTGAAAPGSLRLALLGGDWIPVSLPDRVRRLAPGLRFVALGGATEASIHSTLYEVAETSPRWTSIPYGRPMANQRTYILDAESRPVPPGVPGELHLAGDGLARGYLDQPERTAERFFDWSFGEVAGERLYRTGDIARFGHDGLIELLGRSDFQVKLNGLRIELGDIEAALRGHESVREAVVAAREDAAGTRRLVGYAVPVPGRSPAPAELREHAAGLLPPFMVPGAVLVLDRLPLTPNGKVDRRALPAPEDGEPGGGAAAEAAGVVPPSTATERKIAEILSEVLPAPRFGADSDFFASGGNSLQAVRAVTRINKHFGIKVNVRLLYGGNTVAAIASAVDRQLSAARTPPNGERTP